MSDYTVKRLREWGESLEREHKGGLGASLLGYAEAWEKQLAERDAALARCVEELEDCAEFCREHGNFLATEHINKLLDSLPISTQATAKVLAAARWVAYVTTSKVGDPQGQADAMHDALTELAEAIREEQETK